MTVIGSQIDSDRRLLEFKSYEDYLDSLVTPVDFCYVRSTKIARQLAELGYRCIGETLDRETFYRRLKAVKDLLFPIRRPYELVSEFVTPCNELMQELALRERSNRLRILSTIIFVRQFTKQQFEVSAYIDYYDRLVAENWMPYFTGNKKLWPQTTDLAYYHWRIGKTHLNETANYKPIIDADKGLMFENIHDRKIIVADPMHPMSGPDTTRIRIRTPAYEHVILFDHVVRNRVL